MRPKLDTKLYNTSRLTGIRWLATVRKWCRSTTKDNDFAISTCFCGPLNDNGCILGTTFTNHQRRGINHLVGTTIQEKHIPWLDH